MKLLLVLIACSLVVASLGCLLSCSDDPNGPDQLVISFPNEVGWHWKYQMISAMTFDTITVDVDIVRDTVGAGGKPATMWVVDYHGVLDTVTYQIGDSVWTYIGIIPPPDTCLVSINADSVTIDNHSFFAYQRIMYKYPLEAPKQWGWTDLWGREDHISEVIGVESVTVGEKAFPKAVRIESQYTPVIQEGVWDFIRTSVWLAPDVGMVQAYEYWIEVPEGNPDENKVGIFIWKLMEYDVPD